MKRYRIMYVLFVLVLVGLIVWTWMLDMIDKKGKKEAISIERNIYNAYIIYSADGVIYTYTENGFEEFKGDFGEVCFQDVVADISIVKDTVYELKIKKESIGGRLLSIDDEGAMIEGYGKVPFENFCRIYDFTNGYAIKSREAMVIGNGEYIYYVANGKIAAVVIREEQTMENIRVLIKTTDFQSRVHDTVCLSSKNGLVITKGEEDITGNRELVFDESNKVLEIGESITVKDVNGGKISIKSLERAYGIPEYQGSIEVVRREEGYYIVNELPLEDYLRNVVPSEMPASYELEALKAQAICARTYAYAHMLKAGELKYGAHVDDSVSYQVYNNCNTNSRTDEAVAMTRGQVLMCGDGTAQINYYSTSCGYGGDETVWGGESVATNSLINHSINSANAVITLSDNSAFATFIKGENVADYDYSYPYYRWKGTVSIGKLEAKVNIGKISSIQVTERLENGVVNILTITGSKGKKEVVGQGDIRELLGGGVSSVTNKGGNLITGGLLPSGYFALEENISGGMVTECSIYGGGLGHGVGMSQNAANQMGKEGQKYDEILLFFFYNTSLQNIY